MSQEAFLNQREKLSRFLHLAVQWSAEIGIDPRKFILAVQVFPVLLREYRILKKQNEREGSKWDINFVHPRFRDRYESSGFSSGHYFHQDLLVARRIFLRQPVKHVDVGSRVDGFVAHVAAFRHITVVDIRPQTQTIPNISFIQRDLTCLPSDWEGYCDSLSCLHVLEHFGLGRYGDPLDINGHLKGFDNLYKMLRPNGTLYLSVPIGRERIEFNAHRVFGISTVMGLAKGRFDLAGFSYIDEVGDLHENVILDEHVLADIGNLNWGCGIFEFRKV